MGKLNRGLLFRINEEFSIVLTILNRNRLLCLLHQLQQEKSEYFWNTLLVNNFYDTNYELPLLLSFLILKMLFQLVSFHLYRIVTLRCSYGVFLRIIPFELSVNNHSLGYVFLNDKGTIWSAILLAICERQSILPYIFLLYFWGFMLVSHFDF